MITIQNLRSFSSGAEPDSLLAGQICFNVVDKLVYVGDGSAYKTSFDGTIVAGVPGGGWYSMPMSFGELNDYFVSNPTLYGDIPTDNQVLTWSSALNHPIWTSGGGGGGGQVYELTNNQVAVAPGITVSEKIINATGVASPDEGDMCIVTGQPGEVYQGLYVFTTHWIRVASYANPTAAQVTYDNTASGLPAVTVQQAVDELNTDVIGATSIANTANANALAAQALASAALPKAGGTMTGTITFAAGQTFPIAGIQIASASQLGVVQGSLEVLISPAGVMTIRPATTGQAGIVQLDNTTSSTSTTTALTAAQGKNLQDQINNLSLASNVTLAGTLNAATGTLTSVTSDGALAGFVNGSPLPSPAAGNADYYVIVSTPGSYSPPGGGGPYATANGDWFLSNGTSWQFLGVGDRPAYASTTVAGVVQLATDTDTQTGLSGILAVTPSALQSKVSDVVNLTSSTTIASSTAVKTAYDLANTMLPKAGGTMTGTITFAAGQLFPITGIQDATTTQKGVVQIGSNIDVTGGTISVPAATLTSLGVVQAGSNIDITSGIISVAPASSVDLGVVQIGTNIDVSSGVISVATGTTAGLGVVQVGTNIDVLAGVISVPAATTAAQGAVQVGTNIDVLAGTISVKSASTTQSGVVQLNDTVASTSTTEALTANQGYQLQQQINALATSTNLTFAGTVDGSTGDMLTVTTEGAGVGFLIGSPLPAPSALIDEYFVIVTAAGTMTPTGGSPTATVVGDWFLASAATWTYIAAGFVAPQASTTVAGIVELATDLETQTGTDANRAVTPASLQSKLSDSTSTTSSITIASSTAVKSAYDLANAAIPKSTLTATGAIIYASAANTPAALPIGTAGQVLTVSGGVPAWAAAPVNLCGYTCTTTPFNTALGCNAGGTLTSLSVANTAIGFFALDSETSGDFNTAVGHNALTAQNGSSNNTAIGGNAGAQVTTGGSNTIVGQNAGDNITSGANNTVMGVNALGTSTTACNSVAIGMNAMALSTVGCQVAVGYCALASNGTGVSNTAVGYFSLSQLLAGSQNTAVGHGTGQVLSGQSNTLIGYNAGNAVTTASCNTLVGCSAGSGITTQDGHVAIGAQTLIGALDINNRNLVAVGTCALRAVTTGLNNIGIGFCAGALITTGGCNIAIGSGALDSVTTSANNIGIGFNTLTSITTGSENLAIGTCAGAANTTGSNNTSVGYFAGCSTAANGNNTYLGAYAGRAQTSVNNTAVGACALANAGVNNNTAVGFNAGAALTTGGSNTFLGAAAGDNATTADNAVAVGYNALGAVHTAGGAVAVGVNALGSATSGACNVAVGFNAGSGVTLGSCNVLVGRSAGSSITTGGCNVILGSYAGTAALTNNVVLSDGAGTIRFQANSTGAWSPDGTNFGTTGQLLASGGTGAVPTWTWSIPEVPVPPNSTSGGVQGQVSSDANYFYFYTGGRWQRIAWDATVW